MPRRRPDRSSGAPSKSWVQGVDTASTSPPPGLFTQRAETIARVLASPEVSPRGPSSGLRMLLFYVNRAGRNLTPERRRELVRAERLLSRRVAKERAAGEARGGPRSGST